MSALKGKATTSTGGGGMKGTDAPPAGNRVAVCIAVIDLGTQERGAYNGESLDPVRQVYIAWELSKCLKSGSKEPHVIGERYTLSFHKMAKLVKTLESWRGKDFAPEQDIDLTAILGKPCYINVIHKDAGEDKVYVVIKGVSPLGEDIAKPAAYHKPIFWEIGSPEPVPAHDWLPYCYGSTVADLVKASPEWKELAKHAAAVNGHDDMAGDDGPVAAGAGRKGQPTMGDEETPF
jgi:hypothetical protein